MVLPDTAVTFFPSSFEPIHRDSGTLETVTLAPAMAVTVTYSASGVTTSPGSTGLARQ